MQQANGCNERKEESMSQATNGRVIHKGPPIIIDDLPSITVESINERIEENRTPEEWAKEDLFEELLESDIDINKAIPNVTKIIGQAQAAAIRKAQEGIMSSTLTQAEGKKI